MKPKEWLYKNGHIPDPKVRGRMSREHKALIEQAVRDGVAIDGYAVSTVKPKSETEKSAPTVEKVATNANRVIDIPDETRPESSWTAHTSNGEIGMRTVCNGCKNSLTYCYCTHPRVWISHEAEAVVFFKSRKG